MPERRPVPPRPDTTTAASQAGRPEDPIRSPDTGLPATLLDLLTLALTTVAARRDARAVLCEGLASLVGAPSAAHVQIDLSTLRAELILWRQASGGTRATASLQVPEPDLRAAPEASRWFASAARRATHRWIDLPHLAELPLAGGLDRLCVVTLGRPVPFGPEDERVLAWAGPHLAALEAVRWSVDSAGAVEPPGHSQPGSGDSVHLTHREVEVLFLLREGLLARAIAGRLGLSERTVHKHLASVYAKLGVHDRLLAVRRAESLGLMVQEDPDPARRRLA